MSQFSRTPLAFLVVTLCALPLLGQTATAAKKDLKIIGTWKLNLAKSTFNTGPAPKVVNVHTWWWEGNKLKHKVEILNEAGEVIKISGQWIADFDGEDHLSGGEQDSKVSMKVIDSNNTEMTEQIKGNPLVHFQQAVSKEGSTLTITRQIEGKDGTDIMVHDRVAPQSVSSSAVSSLNEQQRMGRIAYLQNCSFCHYPKNQNPKSTAPGKTIGPALDALFHRDKPPSEQTVRTVILSGVAQKMPSFRYTLTPEELDSVISYLKTL